MSRLPDDVLDGIETPSAPRVWKISELTRQIKGVLEGSFGSVWVEGEISNLRRPSSGHVYFTLKDEACQLRAVMFRGSFSTVKFPVENGQKVRGFGQITVYETLGEYQISLRKLELAGVGELMQRLEALKKKLAAEGLFDADRKRPLPALPQHVGVVTSPTGAAIRDILQVLDRRYANLHVVIAPVRVQGAGAAEEIAAAIDEMNQRGGVDVLIVGRGGGSLEDLWCFNEEIVVRAIARSAIPVISAVGHEIDWTLSDFVADVRAPTPSAAAEMVVQGKAELERKIADLRRRLVMGAHAATLGWRNRLDRAARIPGLRTPLQVVEQAQQRVDFLAVRLQNALAGLPQLVRQRTMAAAQRMERATRLQIADARQTLKHCEAQLRLLNPKGVLARGYSLTRLSDGRILRTAAEAPPGTQLETELADGTVLSTVEAAEGDQHGGKNRKDPEFREIAGALGENRRGDGKWQTGPRKDGGGLRGGPETGQTLLFEIE